MGSGEGQLGEVERLEMRVVGELEDFVPEGLESSFGGRGKTVGEDGLVSRDQR